MGKKRGVCNFRYCGKLHTLLSKITHHYRKLHTLFQNKILPLRKICENKQTIICKLPLNIEEVSIIQEIILGIDIEVIFGL